MWARNSRSLLLATALLAGCAVGPDFVRPDAPKEQGYLPAAEQPGRLEAIGQTQQLDTQALLAADWWRLFGSPQLDAMVATAIADNPGVQGAQAVLRQSQDNLRAGHGVFFPQVGLALGATRERATPARLGLNGPGGIFNLFTLGATISYALDIFGGERRAVEGLSASVDLQRYVLLGTDLTLTGNVVNTAIAREAYAEQMAVLQEVIAIQQEQLSITRTRADAGTVPYSAVESLRGSVATTRAAMAALAQHRDQASHALSLLMGQATSQASPPEFALDQLHLPADLPLSLPSQLVRQRPDILAAEAQLHVANADVGVATAALFPVFSIDGGYGAESNALGDLGKTQSKFWSSGVTADWPVFQGGSAWFGRKAVQEAYMRVLSDYRQTVLAAFAQVADTLKALQYDAEGLAAQEEAMHAAQAGLKLTRANYASGLAGYLDVLASDQQYQQSRLAYVQALAQRYQDTVALYVALGGGWWNAPSRGDGAMAGGTGTQP
ncbi:efflux transporter outer membrane subunit [Dyella jiangningensis]